MKNYFRFGLLLLAVSLYSCGGGEDNNAAEETLSNPNAPGNEVTSAPAAGDADAAKELKPSERIDLVSKGVGPITSVTIPDEIDDALAAKGKEIYDMNCTACHRVDKTLVGPPQKGIMERRTPEWVMNMIMDPEGMVQNDALAKELLMEFNGAPMSNQGITEDEARALVEYFRTL